MKNIYDKVNKFLEPNWKYIAIFLAVALIPVVFVQEHNINKVYKQFLDLKEKTEVIVKPLCVPVHDTVWFNTETIRWKTASKTDSILVLDTLYRNDTVILVQLVPLSLDTFSMVSREVQYNTDKYLLDAKVNIEGRGVQGSTFIDTCWLDYSIFLFEGKEKRCGWLRRIFNQCK